MFFNSLFYVFAAKQQLPNENKNRIFRNVYFENFASQSSVLQITFCVYFCLGYCFYLLCLIFDEVMITCIVITRGLYQTNRTIEFEEYILKEDYHGKSSNKVPFLRDPLPRLVYWANVLITNWMNQKLDMNIVIQFPLRRHFELLWRHLAVTILFTTIAILQVSAFWSDIDL